MAHSDPTSESRAARVEGLLAEILATMQTQLGSASSVEIERNSRGETVKVKAYATSVEEAGQRAQQEYDRLKAIYKAGA